LKVFLFTARDRERLRARLESGVENDGTRMLFVGGEEKRESASGGLDKRRAARIAFLSSMTEPVGALLGSAFISLMGGGDHIIGMCLAFAAGVMTYITVDELIPVAHEYCSITCKHIMSSGLLIGILLGHVLSVVLNI
jgi:zinc transporter ZupT